MFFIIAHFDGAAIKNHGPAGIGCAIISDHGEIIWKHSEAIGNTTNNEAEYRALITLTRQLVKMDPESVIINGDSQLVINQVNGNWKINHSHLYELCQEARKTLAKIKKYQLQWVPREQNRIADYLSKKALEQTNKQPSVFHGKIEKVNDSIYLTYGSKVYAVDLQNQACTCPAFVKKINVHANI